MAAFETISDKINYLKGLIRIAKCDGVIDPTEQAYFSSVANSMGLPDEAVSELSSLWLSDEPIEVFFSKKYDCLFFLQEAIQLCCIDGSYDLTEQAEIGYLAAQWNISDEELASIHAWVNEGLAWRRKGEEMLEKMSGEVSL